MELDEYGCVRPEGQAILREEFPEFAKQLDDLRDKLLPSDEDFVLPDLKDRLLIANASEDFNNDIAALYSHLREKNINGIIIYDEPMKAGIHTPLTYEQQQERLRGTKLGELLNVEPREEDWKIVFYLEKQKVQYWLFGTSQVLNVPVYISNHGKAYILSYVEGEFDDDSYAIENANDNKDLLVEVRKYNLALVMNKDCILQWRLPGNFEYQYK